jgi:hypothetical protein
MVSVAVGLRNIQAVKPLLVRYTVRSKKLIFPPVSCSKVNDNRGCNWLNEWSILLMSVCLVLYTNDMSSTNLKYAIIFCSIKIFYMLLCSKNCK